MEYVMLEAGKTREELLSELEELRSKLAEFETLKGAVRRLEEELRGAAVLAHGEKLKMETLFAALGDGISVQDTEFRVLYQNEAHKKMVGDHSGEYCYRAYQKREGVCDGCHLSFAFQDGKVHRAEQKRVTERGTYYYEITASPLFDDSGKVVAGIEAVRDVTGRKVIERALQESEKRYRLLFQRAADAIFILEAEGPEAGKILAANEAAAEMHGYTVGELLNMRIGELDAPDEVLRVRDRIERILKGEWIKGEIAHRTKDGTIFPVEVSAGLLEIGDRRYVLAFDRDITERKQLEERLRYLSITDELTGLYNRRGFFTLAQQQFKVAARHGKGMALLSADLDGLKAINDSLGHLAGDLALIEAADILKKSFRESDIIGRIGGDEFVVLQMEKAQAPFDTLTARLQENLHLHNARKSRTYSLSMSVGMAHYDPAAPLSLDELLAQADRSLYKQKKAKRKSHASTAHR